MTAIDLAHLQQWEGSEVTAADVIDRALVDRFAATLDLGGTYAEGEEAPAGIHWCLAPLLAPTAQLGPDGHPERGGFLPPVPLPRRMWAGGTLRYAGRFRVGDLVTRRSRVDAVQLKQGRTGALVFVTVRHDYTVGGTGVLEEQQDIVYRGFSPTEAKPDMPPSTQVDTAEMGRSLTAEAPLLFRYSALTFNSHRIHYDRAYCVDEEAYPGLVVHGPLQATYLLQLAIERNGWPASFAFRGQSPLFDGALQAHGRVIGGEGEFWISDPERRTTMTARARWA